MPFGADIRSRSGVPVVADFAGANGTPVVIDTDTGWGYTLKAGDLVVPMGMGGTVTSVGLSAPSGILGVSGSPVTSSGTIALAWAAAQGDLPYGGGTNALAMLAKTATASFLDNSGLSNNPAWSAKAALTKTDDTNITLTLGGAPTTALLAATSLTLGWTGTLAVPRGGTGIGSGTSGGIPYFNSTTSMLSSALLGSMQVVLGGGAGAAPNSSASLTFDGSHFVIGTPASAGAPLHIYSSGTTNDTLPGFQLERSDTTNKTHLQHYFAGINYLSQNMYRDVSGFWFMRNTANPGTAVIQDTRAGEGYIALFTNAAASGIVTPNERMRIDVSGNVGIGTATNLGRFTVKGSSSAIEGGINIQGSGDTTRWGLINVSSANDLALGSWNGSAFQTNVTIENVTGNVGIGTTSPTAVLHLKAGSATANTAPLKLTSGTNLTTAETGAVEYNGTNLFFTRTGTTRETVMTANAVNAVSPTAPDRTITVVIAGTTYYLAAKTTND